MTSRIALTALAAALPIGFAAGQEPDRPAGASPAGASPTLANQTIEELDAGQVLEFARYSYTRYDHEFVGTLRMGLVNKVDFHMSLGPRSIRFLFDDPAQVIHIDTSDDQFALYEGIGGAKMKPVPPAKYGETIRGTDATYDDLSMRFLYWSDARIVREEKVKGRDCWMIRAQRPGDHGAYALVEVWIDQGTGGMLKMHGYNGRRQLIRRFQVLHGKKFGDVWMIDRMRIETIRPGSGGQVESSTRMRLESAAE